MLDLWDISKEKTVAADVEKNEPDHAGIYSPWLGA